jgi:hypothetical protein
MGRWIAVAVAALVLFVAAYVGAAWLGIYGRHEGPGEPTAARIPEVVVAERTRGARRAAASLTPTPPEKQILFGDLHVHTTFSTDAFLTSLPMLQGEGAHPIADACDFARFCSSLDFWSINDHAEASTPRRWQETKDSIRQCNALAGDPDNPDVVAFLGYEWSQVGRTPDEHYGHKNVVIRGLSEEEVPVRPIGAGGLATDALRNAGDAIPRLLPFADFANRQRYWNFFRFLDEISEVPHCPDGIPSSDLPVDCYESAQTPADLFRKLREGGHESIVIPHGNTWGFYSPPGITWDKQLAGAMHDPSRQTLIEVMSGHGNSEEYRDWSAVEFDDAGVPRCPVPREDYLPSCWRAGEIIRARCTEAGESDTECDERAAAARQHYVEAGVAGRHALPGTPPEAWLDSGQCRDCFLPSFNYRPGGSTQYALAISDFAGREASSGDPKRFQFGFIASSDNHRARPGTGYKEFARRGMTEANGAASPVWRERIVGAQEPPEPRSRAVDIETIGQGGLAVLETERQSSFFLTGGLAAVHSAGRSRDAIWDAFGRKEVYGTSGARILLWFHLLNGERPDGSLGAVPMGGTARVADAPRFEVRAVGSLEQEPGCPDWSQTALGPEEIARVCRGECYHPSNRRRLITRIEVVRIRPQIAPDEEIAGLIDDPWRVFACAPSEAGCVVQFEDPEGSEASRDAVYYVRAIEAATEMVNAASLRCTRDADGRCVDVDPCWGDYRTAGDDDCLAPAEPRAWSSPIYVDGGGAG